MLDVKIDVRRIESGPKGKYLIAFNPKTNKETKQFPDQSIVQMIEGHGVPTVIDAKIEKNDKGYWTIKEVTGFSNENSALGNVANKQPAAANVSLAVAMKSFELSVMRSPLRSFEELEMDAHEFAKKILTLSGLL